VVEEQEYAFAAKKQTLSAQLPESVPPIQANSVHLTQAVINLVNNASKYTPEGGYVSVRLFQSDQQHLRLEVQDTGYGIPEEAQAKLFSEFYRVRTSDTENIPGTGLGLSLVKSVVEGIHGRVWVQSKQGLGSTFFVELPVDSSS
jgi:two-component system sensor histidine kinase VicK